MPDIILNNYGASSASSWDQKMEQNYRRLQAKYSAYIEEKDVKPSEAKAHIIEELNKVLKTCLPMKIQNLGNIQDNKGTIYFIKNDYQEPFEFDVLSAGEKEVVDLLLDLYLRRDMFTDTIYIFDEPELHINTAIQRNLLIAINELVPDNCQIWIATHSIGFLRAIQNELSDQCDVIEFKQENKWAEQPYVLVPARKSVNLWRSLFSTALDDLATLVCPKRIIYCEGRDAPRPDGSERGLDANAYNTIFNEKHPNTLFVSSGGNTELDQRSDIAISILSKVFPDLEIWVLKDRDMGSGKVMEERERQIYFQNNPAHHRVLRRFEIENYLFDKEILLKYSSENALDFEKEKYDRCVSNIIDQNLKDDLGMIKACTGIKSSVGADAFKLNLAKYNTSETSVYKELEEVIFERM